MLRITFSLTCSRGFCIWLLCNIKHLLYFNFQYFLINVLVCHMDLCTYENQLSVRGLFNILHVKVHLINPIFFKVKCAYFQHQSIYSFTSLWIWDRFHDRENHSLLIFWWIHISDYLLQLVIHGRSLITFTIETDFSFLLRWTKNCLAACQSVLTWLIPNWYWWMFPMFRWGFILKQYLTWP